jgi:hypothetical protein
LPVQPPESNVSNNDALPRLGESSHSALDAAHVGSAANAQTLQPQVSEAESAASLLSLAERVVRWEDDISAAEIAAFAQLYLQVLQRARQELALPSAHDAPLPSVAELARDPAQARSALLSLRLEAHLLVRDANGARGPQPAAASPRAWLRFLLGALVLAGVALFFARDALVDRLDLGNISRGKPWVASSTHNADTPLSGTLSDFRKPFFFHTAQEASPYIEVDLGAEAHVGSLLVGNRGDCCANRAVPLIVETSRDHTAWHTVATRQRTFSVWRPRVDALARWIRLRVLRESFLHLRALVVRS